MPALIWLLFMNILNKIKVLVILAVFMTCTTKEKETNPSHVFVTNDCQKSINASALFNLETVVSLRLPDSILIGEVTQLVVGSKYIYLLDREQSRSIVCFDRKGNYIFSLQSNGKGPLEFIEPEFMQIDSSQDSLYIYDRHLGKILVYSQSEGKIYREVTRVPSLMCFYFINNGFLISTDDYASGDDKFTFIKCTKGLDQLNSTTYTLNTTHEIIAEAAVDFTFFVADNSLYYLQAFTNQLYAIDQTGYRLLLDLEFEKEPSISQYSGNYQDVLALLYNGGFSIAPHRGNIKKNVFSFFYYYDSKDINYDSKDIRLVTINLSNNEQACYKTIVNDWYGKTFDIPMYATNGIYYNVTPVSELPKEKASNFLNRRDIKYQETEYLLVGYSLKLQNNEKE